MDHPIVKKIGCLKLINLLFKIGCGSQVCGDSYSRGTNKDDNHTETYNNHIQVWLLLVD